ncbi:hypothetical protein ACFV2E_32060 [Streptomyces globisporus]|uniref:hypothetical protein n=1 Tax=Streptomyces globisporus TaxID=1908 RepID=UPI00369B3743
MTSRHLRSFDVLVFGVISTPWHPVRVLKILPGAAVEVSGADPRIPAGAASTAQVHLRTPWWSAGHAIAGRVGPTLMITSRNRSRGGGPTAARRHRPRPLPPPRALRCGGATPAVLRGRSHRPRAAALGGASAELRDAIRPEPDGSTSLRPDRAADVLYDDCPEPLAARAVGLLRSQAPGCGRGVPHHHSWKDTPSTYVVCGQDRAIDPALQRTMASRCTEVREWGTGHSPFVGQPDLLVGLLRELLVTGARS